MNMFEVLIFFSNLFYNAISIIFELTFVNIFILCFLIKLSFNLIYLINFNNIFFFFYAYTYFLESFLSNIEYLLLVSHTVVLYVLNLFTNLLNNVFLNSFILNLYSNNNFLNNILNFDSNNYIIILFWFNTFIYVYIYTYMYITVLIYLFEHLIILSSVTNLFDLLQDILVLSIDWYRDTLNVYYINIIKFSLNMNEVLNNFYLALYLEEENKLLHEDILEFVNIYVNMHEHAALITKEEDITDLIIELYELTLELYGYTNELYEYTYNLYNLTYNHYNEYNYIYDNFWLWNLAILGFFIYMDHHLRNQLEAQGLL